MLAADTTIWGTGAPLSNTECPHPHSPTPLTQPDIMTTTCKYEIGDDSPRGAPNLGNIHSVASLHNITTFNHTTSTLITPTGTLSSNPHTITQDHTLTLREPINIMPKQHLHFPPHKLTTPRHIETKTFCKNIQKQKHLTPPTSASRSRHTPQTLTNPNNQTYRKFQLHGNTTVKYKHVPPKTNGNPTAKHTVGRTPPPLPEYQRPSTA